MRSGRKRSLCCNVVEVLVLETGYWEMVWREVDTETWESGGKTGSIPIQ